MVTETALPRARAGDEQAFRELTDPYRRELQVHCYRILGSVQDAEDALQETLLAAWRGLGGFEGRASIRTWLYQVATSSCLKALRSASRRPQADWPLPGIDLPEPTRLGEISWLEPYPDVLLEGLADSAPGPEARYEATEAISLAFIMALQLLTPRQRAVLILRDVLGFHAREAARMLDSSQESVTSALKRARATLRDGLPTGGSCEPPPAPGSASQKQLIERLTMAYDTGDVDAIVALFTDDAWLTMPPEPLEYQGHAAIAQFYVSRTWWGVQPARLVPTRANNQPALGYYLRDPQAPVARAHGLIVLTLAGDKICAITRFGDNSLFPHFGLPRSLPD